MRSTSGDPTPGEADFGTTAAGSNPAISQRVVVFATITCFLAWAFSVYDYTLFGILLPVIATDLGWSTAFSTAVNSYVGIGMFVLALGVGPMLDYLGRRRSFVLTTVGAALSSGLTALAPNAVFMTIIRSFSGLGYAEQLVNSAYLKEIYGERKRRGFVYSFVQSGFPVGFLIGTAMSKVLVPAIGWRGAFIVGLFPAVVILILRLWLPESPVFEALKGIRKLQKERRYDEAYNLGRRHDLEVRHAERSPYLQIIEPGMRLNTISLTLAYLLNTFGVVVFSILGTTILTKAKGLSFDTALTFLLVANAAAVVGYITHGYLGDRFGRRMTIFVGWLISGAAFTVMLFGPESSGFVLTTYAVGLFFLIGPYAALLFLTAESFPARMRGTGGSIVNAMGLLGLILGSALVSLMLNIGATLVVAAFLAGALTTVLSAFCILGTREAAGERAAPVGAPI